MRYHTEYRNHVICDGINFEKPLKTWQLDLWCLMTVVGNQMNQPEQDGRRRIYDLTPPQWSPANLRSLGVSFSDLKVHWVSSYQNVHHVLGNSGGSGGSWFGYSDDVCHFKSRNISRAFFASCLWSDEADVDGDRIFDTLHPWVWTWWLGEKKLHFPGHSFWLHGNWTKCKSHSYRSSKGLVDLRGVATQKRK